MFLLNPSSTNVRCSIFLKWLSPCLGDSHTYQKDSPNGKPIVTSFIPCFCCPSLTGTELKQREQLCYLSVNDLYLIFYSFRERIFFLFVILAICM
jgi:hypothetical protein